MRYEGIRFDKKQKLLRFLNFKAEYDSNDNPIWQKIYRHNCIPYIDSGTNSYFSRNYYFTNDILQEDECKLVSTTYFVGEIRFVVKNGSARDTHGGFCFIYYNEDSEKYCTKSFTNIDSITNIYIDGINYQNKEFYDARLDYPNESTFYNIISNKSGFYDLIILTKDTNLSYDNEYTENELETLIENLYDNNSYDFMLSELTNYPIYPDDLIFQEDMSIETENWSNLYKRHVRSNQMNQASNFLYNSGVPSYDSKLMNTIEERIYKITEIESSGSAHAMGTKPHIVSYVTIISPQTGMNYVSLNNPSGFTVIVQQGTGIDSVSGSGSYQAGDTVTLSATVSLGYSFDQWVTNTPGVVITNNQFIMPNRNVTVSATALPNNVTITYNANGGSNAPSSTTHYYGTSSSLAGQGSMSKGSDIFLGWAESAAGSVVWQSQATSSTAFGYADSNPTNTQTLYAVWDSKSPGLYETGTNTLLMSWEDLINDEDEHGDYKQPIIEYGEYFGHDNCIISSSLTSELSGDLVTPSDLDGVGTGAFSSESGGEYLTNIQLPDSEVIIYDGAFSGSSITEFEANVKELGYYAFVGCSELAEVTLRNLEEVLGGPASDVFGSDCPSLETVNLLITNPDSSLDGLLSPIPNLENINFLNGSTIVPANICNEYGSRNLPLNISLPNTITTIEDGAFYNCEIASINIPSSLTTIGSNDSYEGAFGSAVLPNNFSLPDLNYVGYYAFDGSNITQINCAIEEINANAFTNCSDLTSVTLQNGTERIGNYAFSNCENLTTISLPASITSLGGCIFDGCYSLQTIIFTGSWTAIPNSLFDGISSITSVTLPNTITSIGDYAFRYTGITQITLPTSLLTIGDSAFNGCSITTLTIPNTVTSIGDEAFNSCPIATLTIPVSVTSIGTDTFYGADSDIVVNYGGTIAQWNDLGYTFDSFNVIHCSNGDITP